jgi:hypothetical protein
MRRSREETAATRAKIVAAAGRPLRARGIDPTTVAALYSAQGLSAGGL